MVILGIMAAVAVPRYLDSISNAEESAENAVISSIRSGLKQHANNELYSSGRATWPTNPFSVLSEPPAGLTQDGFMADTDGENKLSKQDSSNVKDCFEGINRGYKELELKDLVVIENELTELTGSDRGKLVPTDIGSIVNNFLVSNFKSILDFNFTAQVEESFDDIAKGSKDWKVLRVPL